MVCTKCEKKLRKGGPAPDPWKEGSSNDKRKVNENKLLSKSRRFQPYQQKCKTCKSTLHEPQAQYCQSCAYSKGICHMCGTCKPSKCFVTDRSCWRSSCRVHVHAFTTEHAWT